MECRPLHITVISAKDLKDVNIFSKMDVYAEVSIHGDSYNSYQKHKTHIDKDSGTNPTWNFPMKFTIHEASAQENRLNLVFKLVCDRSLGDREIGEVRVPVKELLNQNKAEQEQSFVSYGVRTPKGKIKGTLNFSFKFGDKFEAPLHTQIPKKVVGDEPVMAYPPTGYPAGAGASSGYPTSGGYPPPPPAMQGGGGHYAYPAPGGYPPPPQQQGYYGGYPPHPGTGYGYPGYPPAGMVQPPPKKNGKGKMALGLGAGLLGGLLVGDMISDVGDMAAYDAGYDAGFDDGFDF